jgi:hypothetical protein
MSKEQFVASFKVVSGYLPGNTHKDYQTPQIGRDLNAAALYRRGPLLQWPSTVGVTDGSVKCEVRTKV